MPEPARTREGEQRLVEAALVVERWPKLRREPKEGWQKLARKFGAATYKWEGSFGELTAWLAVDWKCDVSSARRRLIALERARLLIIRRGPNVLKLRVVFPRRVAGASSADRLGLVGQADPQRRLFDEPPASSRLSVVGGEGSETAFGSRSETAFASGREAKPLSDRGETDLSMEEQQRSNHFISLNKRETVQQSLSYSINDHPDGDAPDWPAAIAKVRAMLRPLGFIPAGPTSSKSEQRNWEVLLKLSALAQQHRWIGKVIHRVCRTLKSKPKGHEGNAIGYLLTACWRELASKGKPRCSEEAAKQRFMEGLGKLDLPRWAVSDLIAGPDEARRRRAARKGAAAGESAFDVFKRPQ